MSRRAAGVRAIAPAAALVAVMCASGTARAQLTATGAADRAGKLDPDLQERKVRSGLIISLMTAGGVGKAAGYPNNSNQIGNPSYYSSSDVMLGSGTSLFIGGALADYLNFGFFFGGRSFRSFNWQASMGGFGFRVEAFPLLAAMPKLKDLAIFAQFGIGSATLEPLKPDYPEAKGVQSIISIGAFYEWKIFRLFGGHAVAGPMFEYDGVFTPSIGANGAFLGARVAFYGGF